HHGGGTNLARSGGAQGRVSASSPRGGASSEGSLGVLRSTPIEQAASKVRFPVWQNSGLFMAFQEGNAPNDLSLDSVDMGRELPQHASKGCRHGIGNDQSTRH